MTEYRMVYDSGSKLLKCAIADEQGNIITLKSWEKELFRSADGFKREWNQKNYWDKIMELTKLTIKAAKIEPKDIKYVTASSIRPSCIFTDENNNALFIGAQFDLRGIDYAEEIEEEFQERTGESFYQSTGRHPFLYFVPARYKALREELEKRNSIKSIAQYLPEDSWILVKLGGELHANILSAAESGFFDLKTKMWHPAWNDILDLPEYFFPWPVLPGEIIGTASEEIQQRLGLSSELELVAGIPDTQAALLGSQCVETGSVAAILGSTTPVQILTNRLYIDQNEQSWSGLFTCKKLVDLYYVETHSGITGQLLKWAANLFYGNNLSDLKQRFQKLDQTFENYDKFEMQASIEQIIEDSVFSLLGPVPLSSTQTRNTPGIFYFQSPGGIDEASLTTDAFIAAIFDNIQFAITRNIEFAAEIAKISDPSYWIVGGITRNATLVQRFADILQKTVTTSKNFEASIQGMLVLCDIAANTINSLDDLKIQNENFQLLKTFKPRQSMRKKLLTKYQIWQNLLEKYNE
ncbi:MAG: FGGY family carbohydrate kinase [Candidatus Thorarchaeota archaeon]